MQTRAQIAKKSTNQVIHDTGADNVWTINGIDSILISRYANRGSFPMDDFYDSEDKGYNVNHWKGKYVLIDGLSGVRHVLWNEVI